MSYSHFRNNAKWKFQRLKKRVQIVLDHTSNAKLTSIINLIVVGAYPCVVRIEHNFLEDIGDDMEVPNFFHTRFMFCLGGNVWGAG